MIEKKHYLEEEFESLIRNDASIWNFIRESSLDGVWYWDLENPEAEYMSPEFWTNFGFDPSTKEHLAAEWQDLIFPEDLEIAKENVAKHIADPSHKYDQVVRYWNADGNVSWVRCRGIAIRDEKGNATRLLGAHTDITDQKREENAAQAARDVLEVIFQASSNGLIALSSDGKIVRANNSARHILGGINDPVPFLWPEDIDFLDAETHKPLEKSADPIQRILSGNHLNAETHLMRRGDGRSEPRYIRLQNAQVENKDTGVFAVLIIDDVSEEERNRQVVERKGRLDALGQLTGGIAHDFNNLLAAQIYAVDLARSAETAEMREKYLDIADQTIEKGRALTSRMLTFARRQPGIASVKNTAEVLADFESLVRPIFEADIDIKMTVEDPNIRHFCDQTQLETALMNLVLNARDAILNSEKPGQIKLRARPVRAPNQELDSRQQDVDIPPDGSSFRYVEFLVSDNGIGMDEETLSRCTDPFFTSKGSGSGAGLGLAMVYGFIQQSDGDLRIYSEVGTGTTVQMTLPRGSDLGTREEALPLEEVPRGDGQTLLVVEDEPQLLEVITDVLSNLGYKVVTATSGQEALKLTEEGNSFDLLLTDVVVPGQIGGFELARKVRGLRPDIPIIYMSGYTGFTVSEMGSVQAPLLQKPASPKELATTIKAAFADIA